MARLLVYYACQAHRFPALVVEESERTAYMDALQMAAVDDDQKCMRGFFANRLKQGLDFDIAVNRKEFEPGSQNIEADPTMPPVGTIYDDRPHHQRHTTSLMTDPPK